MERLILDQAQGDIILMRLCHQLGEEHGDFSASAIVALQPRGIHLGRVIRSLLKREFGIECVYGEMDSTFYRDDFRRTDKPLLPNAMNMEFDVEKKRLILIDDVLYTGRSIRATLDGINDFGRPSSIQLLSLINRKYKREVPIQPDYVGEHVDTRADDHVKVEWQNEHCNVWIITDNE